MVPGRDLQYVLWSLLKCLHDSPKYEHAAFSYQLREDDEEGMRAAPSNSSAHSLQVGLSDSSAFVPATQKQAGPLNFMDDQ